MWKQQLVDSQASFLHHPSFMENSHLRLRYLRLNPTKDTIHTISPKNQWFLDVLQINFIIIIIIEALMTNEY